MIDTNKENKIKNNKQDEFSIESQMLHHCGVEGQNGSKKADGVAGVCVAGCRVDHGRGS